MLHAFFWWLLWKKIYHAGVKCLKIETFWIINAFFKIHVAEENIKYVKC